MTDCMLTIKVKYDLLTIIFHQHLLEHFTHSKMTKIEPYFKTDLIITDSTECSRNNKNQQLLVITTNNSN